MSTGAVFTPALVQTGHSTVPLRGPDLESVRIIRDAVVAWEDGLVTYAGRADGASQQMRDEVLADAERVSGAIVPGFVDCHTHLPFFGWRADEFEARVAGRTYRDLHGGGGIFRSARLLDEASDDEVLDFCRPLVAEMLEHGTTAIEMKTGYGLSVEAELRQARLARRLGSEIPQTTAVTLLACHAVPAGRSREEWVDDVCRTLMPSAVEEDLVDAVDIYVEDIAFTLDDLERVADAAGELGLPVRCHADQLGPSGATERAAALGARSADHLNHISGDGVAALGYGPTAAVLLPVSTLFLAADPPPVTDLLASGAAPALASDFNPGTCPCLSMPEVISVAASLYRIPVMTGIAAATINPAWVLGLDDSLGALEPGKRADFVVLEGEDVAMIPYRPGHSPVEETWIAGQRVFERKRRERQHG